MSQASKDDLLAELKSHQLPATLLDAVSYKLRQLEYAEQKVQLLEERLRLQRIEKYGPGSEKLSNLQLELLETEPGVSQAEVQAESQREKPAPSSSSKSKRAHPGRQSLPASLPRVERVISCPPEQCSCKHCQQETSANLLELFLGSLAGAVHRRPHANVYGAYGSSYNSNGVYVFSTFVYGSALGDQPVPAVPFVFKVTAFDFHLSSPKVSATVAPNNATPGKTVVNKALTFYCKSSPSSRVLTSVRNGALLGAAKGAYFGFVSGEIFGGEVTFGLSGVGGAGLGAVIQGTIGATTGVITGFASAEACQAAGAYPPGS